MIGSMYFIGVLVGMAIAPPLADAFGRKTIFIVTLIISVFAQLALILTNNLYEAYVYEFFIGSTFAGRVIVGVSAAFLVWDAIDLGLTVSDLIRKKGSQAGKILREKADQLEEALNETKSKYSLEMMSD